MDEKSPRFRLIEIAAVLGLDRKQAHVLRNAGFVGLRIEATRGTGTRDQLWSLLDALRLAACAAMAPARKRGRVQLPPWARSALFDALDDETLRAALRGDERWVTLDPESSEANLRPEVHASPPRPEKPVVVLLALHRIAADFSRELAGLELLREVDASRYHEIVRKRTEPAR